MLQTRHDTPGLTGLPLRHLLHHATMVQRSFVRWRALKGVLGSVLRTNLHKPASVDILVQQPKRRQPPTGHPMLRQHGEAAGRGRATEAAGAWRRWAGDRGALARCVGGGSGVDAIPVTADDLGTRMVAEPTDERISRRIFQYVNNAMSFGIHQNSVE